MKLLNHSKLLFMKKYIIVSAVCLLVAGAAGAQTTAKPKTVPKAPATTKVAPSMESTKAKSATIKPAIKDTAHTAIARKHVHKATKALPNSGGK